MIGGERKRGWSEHVIRWKVKFALPRDRVHGRDRGRDWSPESGPVVFFGGEFCDVAKSGYPKEDFGQLWAKKLNMKVK